LQEKHNNFIEVGMSDNDKTPVTDDQELAKVLASMNDEANKQVGDDATASTAPTTPAPTTPPEAPAEDVPPIPATLPAASPAEPTPPAITPPTATPPAPTAPTATGSSDLEDIKRRALEELRPIVGKLDLPAEDKFDALLLVIRSSDDQSLIQAAYQAAEGIGDEAKKAQALLDVVKEIEYFSSQNK
jgi:hypothetical protein